MRRQCATGKFRASAAAAAAAVIEGADGIGAAVRQDGLQGEAWEPFRTARLFASWSLEAVLLYLAIRMMLWYGGCSGDRPIDVGCCCWLAVRGACVLSVRGNGGKRI